ncbi:hypothetical protein [Cellulomonas sp. P24]|uniref:hypothetical protein n=1 Tax=Cellulomonas sp. P24 TaxID=2885206 RepID=UPI00216AF504|nr:hypothetical protein [Cellulomonas sp. P24]MCR6492415.1 hypothetical protein [Cellulomonas sp. P24]
MDATAAAGPTDALREPEPGLRRLRHSRRDLRLELLRVNRWRRLVRARIEVAVAAATMPDPLGQDPLPYLGVDVQALLPMQVELETALRSGLPIGELDRLDLLRDLDRRLCAYQQSVATALELATEDFIAHLALHPAAALDLPALQSARESA